MIRGNLFKLFSCEARYVDRGETDFVYFFQLEAEIVQIAISDRENDRPSIFQQGRRGIF